MNLLPCNIFIFQLQRKLRKQKICLRFFLCCDCYDSKEELLNNLAPITMKHLVLNYLDRVLKPQVIKASTQDRLTFADLKSEIRKLYPGVALKNIKITALSAGVIYLADVTEVRKSALQLKIAFQLEPSNRSKQVRYTKNPR
jgi:hypothetical protein